MNKRLFVSPSVLQDIHLNGRHKAIKVKTAHSIHRFKL